jgi:hypothetical protein
MKSYLPHWGTVLIGLVPLALVGIMLVGEDARTSFSGKHVEKGWPLVYWQQDFLNKAAFSTRIGTAAAPAPPPEEGYAPKGEAEIDAAAFWIDMFVSVVIVALPMGLCEWFLRRRARRSAPTAS